MFKRLLELSKKRSFFLFGARSTGKSTLLKHTFSKNETLWCNLLKPEEADRFLRKPETLYEMVMALPDSINHIVIDEVQKAPKLLDVVHLLMGETKKVFIMTGSSARKLKRGVHLLYRLWKRLRDMVMHLNLSSFIRLSRDFGDCEAICLSRDRYLKKIENVTSYFWQDGIKMIFRKHLL